MIWWMFDCVCCSLPQMDQWCYNNLQKLNIVIFIEKSFPMKLLRLQHQLNRMFVFVSVCSWDQIYRHHRIKRLRTTTRTEHFVPCNHQMKDTHTQSHSQTRRDILKHSHHIRFSILSSSKLFRPLTVFHKWLEFHSRVLDNGNWSASHI